MKMVYQTLVCEEKTAAEACEALDGLMEVINATVPDTERKWEPVGGLALCESSKGKKVVAGLTVYRRVADDLAQ